MSWWLHCWPLDSDEVLGNSPESDVTMVLSGITALLRHMPLWEHIHDVGGPSVCYKYVLLCLVNEKKLFWSMDRQISVGGNSKERGREKKDKGQTPCSYQKGARPGHSLV